MFSRIIVRLRWPAAALSAFTLIAMTATYWWTFNACVNMKGLGGQPSAQLGDGALVLHWSPQYYDYFPWFWTQRAHSANIMGQVRRHGSWRWWFSAAGGPVGAGVSIPLWALALPLAAAALAGFRAKRRRRPGLCANCLYPLGRSPVCTECGRSAPSN